MTPAENADHVNYPPECPTCGNTGPARSRSAVDLSLCPDDWHRDHPARIRSYDDERR